jgi:hypothetical protein
MLIRSCGKVRGASTLSIEVSKGVMGSEMRFQPAVRSTPGELFPTVYRLELCLLGSATAGDALTTADQSGIAMLKMMARQIRLHNTFLSFISVLFFSLYSARR